MQWGRDAHAIQSDLWRVGWRAIDYQTELRYTFIELRIVLLGAEVAE